MIRIKTDKEIELLRKAGEITRNTLLEVEKYVKEHSYGLVFEQNLPDAVRLWTKKPAKGDKVNILPKVLLNIIKE